MTDRLVWIDCEMTGLDLTRDALVEIAVIVTDGELTPIAEGMTLIIRPPQEALDGMNDVVRQMHTESGLLPLLADGVSLDEATATTLAYVRALAPEVRKTPLAGNTVHMDRLFLARDMPELDQHLHYRNVDVSSIKELARRWFPKAYFNAPAKTGGHRALGDIEDSITELRYYRDAIFVPAPGPDGDTARGIAALFTPAAAEPSDG